MFWVESARLPLLNIKADAQWQEITDQVRRTRWLYGETCSIALKYTCTSYPLRVVEWGGVQLATSDTEGSWSSW
jgi:hypothetical protein